MSDDHNPTPAAVLELPNENEEDGDNNTSRPPETSEQGKKRELLALEKLACLKHLIQSLDTLVYIELFILYYMDCSFFRLLIRALSQLILFSPMPPHGTPITLDRPYLSGIFIPNLLCLILHAFTARPEAGETMRGYLHGGIIMDLIGQKGPTSKIHLILLDILILGLQCFILSINTEYKVLHFYVKNKEFKNPSPDVERIPQDHDAEERGVVRVAGTTPEDIELQSLSRRTGTSPDPVDNGEGEELEADGEQHELLGNHLLQDPRSREDELDEWINLHYAGIAVVAEFHVLDALRKQYRTYKTRAEMVRATATAFSSGSQGRTSRLASVSDILARAMETQNGNNEG